MKRQAKLFIKDSKIANSIPLIKQLEQEGLLVDGVLVYDDENDTELKRIN